ncbi:MAG TPA: LysR family transcriptional regulator [Magnetospirillaceae bacterium]
MASRVTASLRLKADRTGILGPGKGRLLAEIDKAGSISGAARGMGMSYKRAWDLVADLNALFKEPVVQTSFGGAKGGGAALTPFGQEVLKRYRTMLEAIDEALSGDMAWLDKQLAPEKDGEKDPKKRAGK